MFSLQEAGRPPWRACGSCVLLSSIVLGCGAPHVDKPPAPDMTELVDSYEHPSASFDAERVPEVVASVVLTDELLERTNLRTELVNVLREVLDSAVEASTQVDDELQLEFEADGYMRITRICSGWITPAEPDRLENGALLVTATFTEQGLDPTLWGEADRCRYLAGDVQVELLQNAGSSDAVKVYWGEAIEAEQLDQRALIVDMNLSASLDGESLPLDFDFRSLADGSIEYRIPQDDGSLVASVGASDRLLVRASNGTFDCQDVDCQQISDSGEP